MALTRPFPGRRASKKRVRLVAAPYPGSRILSLSLYQGTILRKPFFFLLVDSLLFLASAPFGGLLCASVGFAALPSEVAPAAEGSAFASAPVVPVPAAVEGAAPFVAPPPLVAAGSAGDVGSLGGSLPAGGFAELPSAGAAVFSAPLVVPFELPPAVTVATIPEVAPPAPIRDCPPLAKISPVEVSVSGCRFGGPVFAAACSSAPGPFFRIPSGFLTRLVRFLGVFCSARIHATALGSACGTGAPSAVSLFFASEASPESG